MIAIYSNSASFVVFQCVNDSKFLCSAVRVSKDQLLV